MSICLNDLELHELTGKQRQSAQARALDKMRIPYKRRPDGSVVVFREALHASKKEGPAPARLRLS